MTREPPYFEVPPREAPLLELAARGTHEECLELLRVLQERFGAVRTGSWDPGPTTNDKEKGYHFLLIRGQEFVLMRDRGYGICLTGPKPPASAETFREIASAFGAPEYRAGFPNRLARLWSRLRRIR